MIRHGELWRSHLVHLSLGSNLGDRRAHLSTALSRIELAGSPILRCSSVYETEPVDVREQPAFLNLACAVTSRGTPHDVLRTCREIEASVGRRPSIPKGPRIIDIDMLFFDDRLISTPELTVPHPRLQERRFVLVPLAEISDKLVDPRSGLSVAALLARCPDLSWVREAGKIRW